ncbi:MAG: glycosyltransferase family 1 protein [Deltaproteobacteria bacterium HGW-Deltaproteobacteria-6]|jgi:glycosyltransferase involved in cell wall biosynthesis|nr:MAG: glycosyltransferase family 1 protein [Deltaproteobacteria bacterium HGW-Deltaproteobacteria-6]PKN96689.1 MAG: glycosyltransferase family 1 protein [Chloroflexi bacterium HGW-Chloroflexi-5]
MASGNGAYVVHKLLESHIPGYTVIPYNPYRTLFPPSLLTLGRLNRSSLIHSTPDYAIFHAQKNVPLILTFHNYVLDRFMKDYSSTLQNIHYQTDLKLFTKLAVIRADIITAVSHFTANLVQKEMTLSESIKVIYNGVDHTLFTPEKQRQKRTNRLNVLFCGNLTRRKGMQWIMPIVKKLNRNINIVYTAGLRSSGKLPDHPQLQCLGAVPYHKMPAVYRDADILLFPTVREGFGLAAAEAMSCGLPVIATDCSSLPELIDEEKGGFLCPLGNVVAFADKIHYLAENPRLRREMGDYNRAKVEQMFTLDRMVAEYQELFEKALSK